ncbi:MAG: OmpA family protein [Sumerlaeia bacterium]
MSRRIRTFIAAGSATLVLAAFAAGCGKKPIHAQIAQPLPPAQPSASAEPALQRVTFGPPAPDRLSSPTVEIIPEPPKPLPVPRRDSSNVVRSVAKATIDPPTGLTTEVALDREVHPLGVEVPELPMVYFEFDNSDLTDEARQILDLHVDFLGRLLDMRVIVRGHTDERGTEEYNLALGSRRAMAVRQYLIERGIAPDRLETVSYGEMMPLDFDAEPSPETWARNRRVEFFVFQ